MTGSRADTARPDGLPATASASDPDGAEPQGPDADTNDRVQAFLTLARTRFQEAATAESECRQNQLDDLKFTDTEYGQWDPKVRNDRVADGRPCLTIDRLQQPIKQVANLVRENRPSIQVNPRGSDGQLKVAEILQSICRDIEHQSDADVAYTTAGDQQAKMGLGYITVRTQFIGTTFDQEIVIERERNRFRLYTDPSCQKFDFSDARYFFKVTDFTREEYADRYGIEDAESLDEFASIGDQMAAWMPNGGVRVAEYWYIETQRTRYTLVQIPSPPMPPGLPPAIPEEVSIPSDQVQAYNAQRVQSGLPPCVELDHREVETPVVKWATISPMRVLEGNDDLTAGREWIGSSIPMAPVIGEQLDVDGKVDYRGLTRKGKDPQRMINYSRSGVIESMALAPKQPFIMAEGQMEGHESEWGQSNVRNTVALQYKPVNVNGQLAPPPQRQTSEPPIQAMMASATTFENDLRAVTGYLDVGSAEQQPESSGKAILARERQSQMGNSDYPDNQARAIKRIGEILIDLIPKVYKKPQILSILGKNQQPTQVLVHSGQSDAANAMHAGLDQETRDALDGIYDLSMGRYAVTVSVGPAYESQRQAAVESMMQLVQANPQIGPFIADLLVKNMDWPGAQEIAARLHKMLPPQLQDTGASAPPIPPQLQAQMNQLLQQHDQLVAALNKAEEVIRTEQQKLDMQRLNKQDELASKERIAAMQGQVALIQTESKINADKATALLQAEMARLEQFVDVMHTRLPVPDPSVMAPAAPSAPSAPIGQPQVPASGSEGASVGA